MTDQHSDDPPTATNPQEGNRDHPVNKGVLCAKGSAGIMNHYSPARLSKPLRRVGPQAPAGNTGIVDLGQGHSHTIVYRTLLLRERRTSQVFFNTAVSASRSPFCLSSIAPISARSLASMFTPSMMMLK